MNVQIVVVAAALVAAATLGIIWNSRIRAVRRLRAVADAHAEREIARLRAALDADARAKLRRKALAIALVTRRR